MISAAKKRRDNKEKIDRHVGQNEKRHERNLAFPFEVKRADILAMGGDPIATAINDQEQDGQPDRDDQGFATFNSHGVQRKP